MMKNKMKKQWKNRAYTKEQQKQEQQHKND